MNVTIENFIGIFEDVFSKEYCDSVIQHFEKCHAAGLSSTRQQNNPNTYKTSIDDTQVFTVDFLRAGEDLIQEFTGKFWSAVHTAYADKFDVLKRHAEYGSYTVKLQRTEVGQGYHIWHCEAADRESSRRVLVWTLYLNDVEEGGETEFLYYPKRIKAKAGTVVVWPTGFTHTHRGNPPISNTKYIATGMLEF